jgi:dipeptidyl aminopeptidase/acylaminoacyl peptidase
MTDIKRWIRGIETLEPPEMWPHIESGVQDTAMPSSPSRLRRALIAAVSLLVFAAAAALIWAAFGPSRSFRHERPALPGSSLPADLGSPVPIHSSGNGLLAYTVGGRLNGDIHLARADGSPIRTIPSPANGIPWDVAWSPDGRQLAVAVFDDFGASKRALWVIDANGSNATKIASAYNVHRPSWSPDGSWIAYSIDRAETAEIHVARPDGSDDTVVRSEPRSGTFEIFSATFSPDGTEILFDEGTESHFDVFVMDADGSNVRQLTRTGIDYNPAWSPDGQQIVFTRQEGASSDIFLMNADGSNVRRLTDGGPDEANLNPIFSPDGKSIAYLATGGGNSNPIIEIQLDGSDPQTVVDEDVLGFSWAPAISES